MKTVYLAQYGKYLGTKEAAKKVLAVEEVFHCPQVVFDCAGVKGVNHSFASELLSNFPGTVNVSNTNKLVDAVFKNLLEQDSPVPA